MTVKPRRRNYVAFLLMFAFAGCSGGLTERPDRSVDLSGRWSLNEALSDDTRRVVEQQQGHMRERARRQEAARGFELDEDFSRQEAAGMRAHGNAMRKLFAMLFLDAPRLEIRQSPRSLVVSNGESSAEYVFGQKSVVSMLSGAADRYVGWQSNVFVVQTRSPDGPNAVQAFRLSADGKQLTLTAKLSGVGEGLAITRVFNRLTESVRPDIVR